MTRQPNLPHDVAQAITDLLDFLWDAEKQDFKALDPEQSRDHIFLRLQLLAKWIGHDPEA